MEDGPHDLRIVNSSQVVSDIKAENDLVQLGFFDTDALVSEGWWKFSQEVWQSDGSHVKLAHWVVFGPSVLECFDILFLEGQDVVFVLRGLVVIETLTDNGNEDIHENEEGNELVKKPVAYGDDALSVEALVHDTVPRLSGGTTPKRHHRDIEGFEVDVVVKELVILDLSEKTHTCDSKGEENKNEQKGCVDDVSERHEQRLKQGSKTFGGLDHSQQSGDSNDCLLYTSPSPRDATLSRMPSSA